MRYHAFAWHFYACHCLCSAGSRRASPCLCCTKRHLAQLRFSFATSAPPSSALPLPIIAPLCFASASHGRAIHCIAFALPLMAVHFLRYAFLRPAVPLLRFALWCTAAPFLCRAMQCLATPLSCFAMPCLGNAALFISSAQRYISSPCYSFAPQRNATVRFAAASHSETRPLLSSS